MKPLLLLLLIAAPTWAQNIRWSGTTGDITTTSLTATIQQPATAAKAVALESAVIYCANACTITQAQNGTGATTTAVSLVALTNTSGTIKTTFFKSSNVGAGTAVAGTYRLAAGQTMVLDLSRISLPNTSAITVNYSVTAASSSGVINITFIGSEK